MTNETPGDDPPRENSREDTWWHPLVTTAWLASWPLQFGVAGFLAGFLGPIALHPGSNQGPVLGILITGPAGCVLGLALGAIGLAVGGRSRGRATIVLLCTCLLFGMAVLGLVAASAF